MTLPRHPVYVISKGRPGVMALTARFLARDGVPFWIVVEPQDRDVYAETIDPDKILVLPFSNLGQGSIPARNWVWEHAKASGADRHWILDDNIRMIYRRYKSRRIPCNAGPALAAVEDLVDRYENVPLAGLNYSMFCPDRQSFPAFFLNCHVYSCLLIKCAAPYRWRGRYNEDTDLCLQVLAGGECTILVHAFLIYKIRTMTMKGGNADDLYKDDGRLKMAMALKRLWPGVVEVRRRFKRPQHVIDWKKFTTPLVPRKDVPPPRSDPEYGMRLTQVRPVRSPLIRQMLERAGDPDEPGA